MQNIIRRLKIRTVAVKLFGANPSPHSVAVVTAALVERREEHDMMRQEHGHGVRDDLQLTPPLVVQSQDDLREESVLE